MATLVREKLRDGTHLVYDERGDKQRDHLHVGPDGTLLTVKQDGFVVYRAVRKVLKGYRADGTSDPRAPSP